MSPEIVGVIGFIGFIVLMALRMPISITMGLVGFLGFSYLVSMPASIRMVVQVVYATFSSYSLSVIPFFVWMGFLAYYSGLGQKLFSFANKLIGHLPGGLALASQMACAIFGAICGSIYATSATIGAIAIPEMKKHNYDDSLSTASVAAGGILGGLIPPSVALVIYGIAAQQPIGRLFIAGISAGVVLMLIYMICIWIMVIRNPKIAPKSPPATIREIVNSLSSGIPEVLIIFSISLGGLFLGWFTPSEAGGVGAAGVLLVTVIRRQLSWQNFVQSVKDTTKTTAMIYLMISGAFIFGRFLAVSRIPFELANWAGDLALPAFAIMAVIFFIYFILGFFIEGMAIIVLTIPVFYPIVVNTLGYDPIWFGVMLVVVSATGVITPPVGMNIFVIKGVVPDIPLEIMFKGIWPFIIAIGVCLALLTAFPQIVLYLPSLISY